MKKYRLFVGYIFAFTGIILLIFNVLNYFGIDAFFSPSPGIGILLTISGAFLIGRFKWQ